MHRKTSFAELQYELDYFLNQARRYLANNNKTNALESLDQAQRRLNKYPSQYNTQKESDSIEIIKNEINGVKKKTSNIDMQLLLAINFTASLINSLTMKWRSEEKFGAPHKTKEKFIKEFNEATCNKEECSFQNMQFFNKIAFKKDVTVEVFLQRYVQLREVLQNHFMDSNNKFNSKDASAFFKKICDMAEDYISIPDAFILLMAEDSSKALTLFDTLAKNACLIVEDTALVCNNDLNVGYWYS